MRGVAFWAAAVVKMALYSGRWPWTELTVLLWFIRVPCRVTPREVAPLM